VSTRTQRVAKLLQREIAEILLHELPQAGMVTITGVRVTKDLGIAYVDVSVLGTTEEQRQEAFESLEAQGSQLRGALARRVRHQMRTVPALRFFLDESLQHASKMEDLFETIRRERAQRESS